MKQNARILDNSPRNNMNKTLTVIVSFDRAHQAEELNHPTEALLHLKHEHTRQDLKHTQSKGI